MAYTALYRKFRPDCFEHVWGQDHIVTTLRNQIKAGRVGHAYLFCGTRGTGKTSVAKIFARAVNCERPAEGSPCGECDTCRSIAAGTSMNVIEIDAASNNGVDNIREIVDEVSYSPAEGKYKVYIIDEVHMLSIGAFNALLKTLEEPPEYVIFILATTEVHKIPVTILSRCQRYDFRRITVGDLVERMRELSSLEGMQVEERALSYIAKSADGSMRDALSLLDQCAAFHFGQELTYEKVLDVLGAVDTEVFGRLFRLILAGNVAGAVELLEEIVMQGRELAQFVTDFTWYLRNLMLVKTSENAEEVIDVSDENLRLLKEEAALAQLETIMRYIRIFSELSGKMRYAAQKRILVEMAIIKLCKPETEKDISSLGERIRLLEEKVEKGLVPSPARQPFAGAGEVEVQRETKEVSRRELPRALPEDVRQVSHKWKSIVEETEMPMRLYLKKARLSLGAESELLLVFDDSLAADYFRKQTEHLELLKTIVSQRSGKAVEIAVRCVDGERGMDDSYIDLTSIVHMEVEIEENQEGTDTAGFPS